MGRWTLMNAFGRGLAPAHALPLLAGAGAVVEALVLARVLRSRKDLNHRLDEQARELEGNRAGREHAAVLAERTRIALELHDVVAHDVSVMVVQAGAARRALDRDPGAAVGALGVVESTGREALTEMRRLLDILRPDGQHAEHAPQPSLERLSALVARSRDAGLEVDLRVEGEPGPLAPGVDLTAFRLVQQGLTNALDDGGGGQGLIAMRERVALCGGELRAGPIGRGFVVRARLPRERDLSPRARAAA